MANQKKIPKHVLAIRLLLLVGTAVSLFFVPWILVKAWIMPLPNTVQQQVEDSLNYGFDGVIVYVDQSGKSPEFYAAGWKDKTQKIPADPHSLFKIASISKLYVAVSIAKLAHQDNLSLDDTVADYFPELVGEIEYADHITIKMLVSHRSGIPNFTDNPDFWQNEQKNGQNPLPFALALPTSFEPDQGYEYSNTNYYLLRQIINKVTGRPHHEYIKQEILKPLDLNNTFASMKDVNLDDVMSGYYVGVDADFKENENGMLATAEDVGRFIRALNDGSVFKPGEKAIYDQLYEYEHGGLVPGYQSLAEYHKNSDTVIVQFMNTTDFEGYHWNLSQIFMGRIKAIIDKRTLNADN